MPHSAGSRRGARRARYRYGRVGRLSPGTQELSTSRVERELGPTRGPSPSRAARSGSCASSSYPDGAVARALEITVELRRGALLVARHDLAIAVPGLPDIAVAGPT